MIAPDSTSYPTQAVIDQYKVEQGAHREAVWHLSAAIYRHLRDPEHGDLPAHASSECVTRYGNLKRLLKADEDWPDNAAFMIATRLEENHRRSIAYFMSLA